MFPLQDDEEPNDAKFQIDGSYIPRIFILGNLISPLLIAYNYCVINAGFWE